MTQPGKGKWCLGHGVLGQAESVRLGHFVEADLVASTFSTRDGATRASKGLARTSEPRCNLCRSIRRWHDHHQNAKRRASQWRRQHTERWAEAGRSLSVEAALTEMNIGLVTETALVEMILSAIGATCPGLCAHEIDGELVFHKIERVADLHVDVKDPAQPFTLENLIVLCKSCNTAKGAEPWASFIFRRLATLQAWRAAIANPLYRRSEQLMLNLGGF